MALQERRLITLSQQGEVAAFEELVEEYQGRIYNLAFRMLGNSEDALDVCQESFLKAYKALPRFRGDSSFSTWLYRIAQNVCLDALRRRNRQITFSLDEDLETEDGMMPRQFSGDLPDPEETVVHRELQHVVDQALSALSEDHRQIIVLRDFDGCSYEEIADILDIELGTVKSRLYRARSALHRLLEPMELFREFRVNRDEGRGDA